MAWDYSSLGTDWASDSAFPNCAGERQSPINIISNDVIPANDLPVLRKTCPSKAPVALNAQHDPHDPWSFTGVTAPNICD